MATAFLRALQQLGDPRIVRLLGICAVASLLTFLAAWAAIGWALAVFDLTSIGWLETTIDVLGGIAAIALTWLLGPLVVTTWIGLLLEPIAAAVEARHYPDLPPAPGLPWWQSLLASLRFLAIVLTVNLLLLALLVWPPVYAPAYAVANGWLVGREYFDLVALRRLPPSVAAAMRRRHRIALLATGCLVTAMFTVPGLNLVTPVIATAAMVHRCEAWRRRSDSG